MERPVTVGISSMRPSSTKRFPIRAEPPAAYKSKAIYLPPGLRSPITGVVREISSKASISKSVTPASVAIASKCKIALVEAAVAESAIAAFIKDFFVIISRGKRFSFTQSTTIWPARYALSFLSSDTAGTSFAPIGESPRKVIAIAIELAVN